MSDERTLKRILIFDDDADLRKLLLVYLGKFFEGVELEEYDPLTLGAPEADYNWSRIDVLILDYFLCIHGVTGLDILHSNRNNPDFPATIMLTGAGNEEVAVRSLKAGVYDYLRKQSLDKQQLHDSIVKAFKSHGETQTRKLEITQHGLAFNKSLFYQQLEFHKDLPEYRDRVLLLIELDDHNAISQSEGVIVHDNIVRHIAKQSFEIFNLGECNPSISRLSNAAIALLIDMPDSRRTLEFNLNGLLNHLSKRPYKFNGKKFGFSVSIGVLQLSGDGEPRDIVINKVKDACNKAANIEGNSYYINVDETDEVNVDKTIPALSNFGQIPELSATSADPEPQSISDPKPVKDQESRVESGPKPVDSPPDVNETPELELEPIEDQGKVSPPVEMADFEPELSITPEPEPLPDNIPPAVPEVNKTPDLQLKTTVVHEKPAGPIHTIPAEIVSLESESDIATIKTVANKEIKKEAPAKKVPTLTPSIAKTSLATEKTRNSVVKPKKSLEELKAEMENKKSPDSTLVAQDGQVEASPEKSEMSDLLAEKVGLDESTFSDAAKELRKDFDDKRVILAYQPVISFLNEEMDSDDEIHHISIQHIDKDGTIRLENEIRAQIIAPEFQKFVDRWLLREVIGTLTNIRKTTFTFIVKLSDASLADSGFFNWLRKLLTGLDTFNPGKFIILQIDANHLVSLEKQASALISYLRKTHDFKFVLGEVANAKDVVKYANKITFDLIRCNNNIIKELQSQSTGSTMNSEGAKIDDDSEGDNKLPKSQLDLIKSKGTRFISDGIENSTSLTEAIELGAEYAMGDFIGEPLTQFEDTTNIETFELI